MAAGALIGGGLGGKVAGKFKPAVLRWVVVVAGVAIAIIYWVKSR